MKEPKCPQKKLTCTDRDEVISCRRWHSQYRISQTVAAWRKVTPRTGLWCLRLPHETNPQSPLKRRMHPRWWMPAVDEHPLVGLVFWWTPYDCCPHFLPPVSPTPHPNRLGWRPLCGSRHPHPPKKHKHRNFLTEHTCTMPLDSDQHGSVRL